jgi:hypothetical protein
MTSWISNIQSAGVISFFEGIHPALEHIPPGGPLSTIIDPDPEPMMMASYSLILNFRPASSFPKRIRFSSRQRWDKIKSEKGRQSGKERRPLD